MERASDWDEVLGFIPETGSRGVVSLSQHRAIPRCCLKRRWR